MFRPGQFTDSSLPGLPGNGSHGLTHTFSIASSCFASDILLATRMRDYLLEKKGSAAVAEFEKLLDHRGIVLDFVTGALARLQLGRAYAMSSDSAKAKIAYQDFLTLWKDADPDIPILKQAKSEYAKLQ